MDISVGIWGNVNFCNIVASKCWLAVDFYLNAKEQSISSCLLIAQISADNACDRAKMTKIIHEVDTGDKYLQICFFLFNMHFQDLA